MSSFEKILSWSFGDILHSYSYLINNSFQLRIFCIVSTNLNIFSCFEGLIFTLVLFSFCCVKTVQFDLISFLVLAIYAFGIKSK
jgi:hypothetical protein